MYTVPDKDVKMGNLLSIQRNSWRQGYSFTKRDFHYNFNQQSEFRDPNPKISC